MRIDPTPKVPVDLPGPLGAAGHADHHDRRLELLAAQLDREVHLVERELRQRAVDQAHAGEESIPARRLDLVALDEIEMLGLALLEVVVHRVGY
jgi:hypothetical protein